MHIDIVNGVSIYRCIDIRMYQCIAVYVFYGNVYFGFILEKIVSLLSGITIGKAQVYSNALKSSDVLWYRDTFGMMH